jgi:hypothetical protein
MTDPPLLRARKKHPKERERALYLPVWICRSEFAGEILDLFSSISASAAFIY